MALNTPLAINDITFPVPGVCRFILSDGSLRDVSFPQGVAGKDGLSGITPSFVGGGLVLQPFGSTPAIIVRSTPTPNLFAIDMYMPDPQASAQLANQAAGTAIDAAASVATSVAYAEDQVDLAAAQVALATTKANNAAGSATAAAGSATAAAATLDQLQDLYLTPKVADPTVDDDGNALQIGAQYFNTTAKRMRVFDGTAWQTGYTTITGAVVSFNGRDGIIAPLAGDYKATQVSGLASRALLTSMIF